MLTLRLAALADGRELAELIEQLGYTVSPEALETRLAVLCESAADRLLVATDGGRVVGLIGCHAIDLLHIPGRLGRITVLVVAAGHRRLGVGAQLLAAAEEYFKSQGCSRIEVTSAARRDDAHAFYRSLGFAESSKRFVKTL